MKTEITQVVFNQNSSYFNQLATEKLDDSLEQLAPDDDIPSEDQGFMVLEYQLNQESLDVDQLKYNRWLADRRINRVKLYLSARVDFLPILSRINTASAISDRSVYIHWCHKGNSPRSMLANADNPIALAD